MSDPNQSGGAWTLLTGHGHVLVEIARNPEARIRDISPVVGLTERSVQAIVADLEAAGYLTRARTGGTACSGILPRMGTGSARSWTSSPPPGPRSHPDRKIPPIRDRVIPESNCGLTPLIPDQRDAGSTRTSTRKTFALEWVINVVVQLTIAAWLALEAGLMIRDRVRGKGSAARDRGTLWLNIIIITAAVVAAGILTDNLQDATAWQFGSAGLSVAGLLVMWAGLAIRIWAIVVLGTSFRMTVEVDTGQKVIDSGPYRWVRHPSYTGILLLMAGLSLVYGDWPALAILLVLPAGVLIHRIFVEEAVLTEVIGRAYTDYAARTKRLVPGLW